MALNPKQQQIATQLYQLAVSRGLPPPRAREFVAAAYAESGLSPTATNKSSGAAGLYQLLSSGYRNKAQQFGGLFNPRANAQAILPDYLSYWRQHPNAAPGEGGAAVERSGMGAGFYSRPLGLLGSIGGGAGPAMAPPSAAPPAAVAAPDTTRLNLARQLAGGGQTNLLGLALQAAQARRTTPQPPARSRPTGVGAGISGKIIGTPGRGTHTLGNWESDRAVDEALPVGTPVRAPFDGTIGQQFGSLGEGGRFAGLRVHVVGQNDEAYLAHLEKFAPGIKPGARVQAGQIIGYSGSASGVAHLHEALKRGNPRTLIPRT